MRTPFLIAIVALGAAALMALVPYFHLRVFCLLLCLAVSCMAFACAIQNTMGKYTCITLFSLLLGLLILEGNYYWIIKRDSGLDVQRGGIFLQGLAKPHPDFGYAPAPGNTVHSRVVRDGVELYNVTYTINEEGRRVTPKAPEARTAVLFFGCSFTFAEGLEDSQTLVWKLGEHLGKDYQVYNFGLSGYGTHHMLAMIEKGLPDLSRYDRVLAYHIAIEGHQRRVAGVSPWDKNGPRYVVEQGKAVRKGTFADNPPFFWEGSLGPWLDNSFFFRGIKQPLSEKLVPLNTVEKRMELTKAIIATSAQSLRDAFPSSSFTVLAWPPHTAKILPPLPDNVPLLDVEQWLPGYAENRAQYVIAGDSHPNALANALVAEKLAQIILKEASPQPATR